MKYALLSDIHANLEALETCLALCEEAGADRFVCLGDIVGYGADPAACVDAVLRRADVTVMGNHDAAVARLTDVSSFNALAREAVKWTQEQVAGDRMNFLAGLPYMQSENGLLFVHATPASPEQWYYISSYRDARLYFGDFDEKICFVGHSHYPGIYAEDGGGIPHTNGKIPLDPSDRYIINTGSVGQPRDGDPRLSFALYDPDEYAVEIVRHEYDIEGARAKILAHRLPAFLADRLLRGR